MASTPAQARSYVSRAFCSQYNLIFLFGALAFSLASASPEPLAVGLALEALWLGLAPNLPPFRRWLDKRERLAERAEADRAFARRSERLTPQHARRVAALHGTADEIHGLLEPEPGSALERALSKLDALKAVFVELCAADERLSQFLSDTTQADLELELVRLNESFEAERDLSVRFALRQSIQLAERRVTHRERVTNTRRVVALKLETLEKSVAYLRSQALGVGPPYEVIREINALEQQMGFASALEDELRDLLDAPGATPALEPSLARSAG